MLELDDIQSGVLRPRPSPYAATYVIFRIDDHVAGRALMGHLRPLIASAAAPLSPAGNAWLSVALTYRGLEALAVPRASLETFAWEFRQGMRSRANVLGDTGESAPEHWEQPLGTDAVHVVLVGVGTGRRELDEVLAGARDVHSPSRGIEMIWRQDCEAPVSGKEPFGFRDGIGHPPIEGSSIPVTNRGDRPLKAGEFVLGYVDETGTVSPIPQPNVLGRNGTYAVFRKLHQRVAQFRRYLKENARTPGEEEVLAAKMLGRWRSGAPLALSPDRDDPALGEDTARNDDFGYADDPTGYKTPPSCHIRRTNPRDAAVAGMPRLHRIMRRGTVYGAELPADALDDDGVDRGLMFTCIGAHLGRQFEFVQSEWINGGEFLSLGDRKDPVVGANDSTTSYAFPKRPIPRCLHALPRFVVTRGGEYCFMPSLSALRWLAELT